MGEWQPAETAPIGELVLVYIPAREITTIAGGKRTFGPMTLVAERDKHGWSRPWVYDDSDLDADDQPSHWHPLPEAPKP